MLQFFFTWTLTTSCHCLIKVFIINNKIATSGLRSQYSEKIIISPRHKLKTYKDTLNIFIDVKFSLNENFPFWVVYLELLNVHKRQESRANVIWSRHFLRDVVRDESEIVNRWLRSEDLPRLPLSSLSLSMLESTLCSWNGTLKEEIRYLLFW